MTEKQQKAIDDIMDNFDFHKVHLVMDFMNWQWKNAGVPDVSELKKLARRLLRDSINEKTMVSTGGFVATYEEHDEVGIALDLKFVLEEWEWDEYTDGDDNE